LARTDSQKAKLRSGVKRIRAVARIDLAQDDREAQWLRLLLLERDSIVGGGQQPSPLRYSSASASGISGGAPSSSERGG